MNDRKDIQIYSVRLFPILFLFSYKECLETNYYQISGKRKELNQYKCFT